MPKPKLPNLVGNTQLDSEEVYEEPVRPNSYVMGSADGVFGRGDGFRFGIETTGMRHKKSDLGKIVRRG